MDSGNDHTASAMTASEMSSLFASEVGPELQEYYSTPDESLAAFMDGWIDGFHDREVEDDAPEDWELSFGV